ncbi:hypothetical protein RXV86_02455 [Alisedimentitalea sp. MJ-SS2]|uniref:hypothetical protein n=1 Tax=Aliisedimentitalea sp. MJ-SS2 TaxID=3049795 RepID=UPI00290745DC|nr:hypothetical protein [Alisedimentitalea sp. MJ-SS2]MDU8926236.1 hypothetical protein [Alisedimentitalea sp. MJ-SS2]
MSSQSKSIALVVASHNQDILGFNLKASPCLLNDSHQLHVIQDAPSASIAYNRGLELSDAEIIVFVHHDVYLPVGWSELLQKRVAEVEALDPDWALLGPVGVDEYGTVFGPVWSTSLGQIVGRVPTKPVPIQSYDELMIVMRRDAGLRFDEKLPNFHLYGTDIVQTALGQNKGCYSVSLPVIHNDGFHDTLGEDFSQCLRYMQKKWHSRLPLKTAVTEITRSGIKHWREKRRAQKFRDIRLAMTLPTDTNPACYAELCGWQNIAPLEGTSKC